MKVSCPACKHVLSGPKSSMGTRVGCPECRHSFFWTDFHHAGETFVVYDLETTGLDPVQDELIQVAAMRFSSGCLCQQDTFASFAKPRRPISSFIESYTGIGNRHVEKTVLRRQAYAPHHSISCNAACPPMGTVTRSLSPMTSTVCSGSLSAG